MNSIEEKIEDTEEVVILTERQAASLLRKKIEEEARLERESLKLMRKQKEDEAKLEREKLRHSRMEMRLKMEEMKLAAKKENPIKKEKSPVGKVADKIIEELDAEMMRQFEEETSKI